MLSKYWALALKALSRTYRARIAKGTFMLACLLENRTG